MNMHNAQNTISVSSTVHKYLTGNLKKTNKGFPPLTQVQSTVPHRYHPTRCA